MAYGKCWFGILTTASVAALCSAYPAYAQAVSPGAANGNSGIETVTVTAEKKSESAQNVPMSLSALSGEDLIKSQSFRYEDYVGKVPGLTWVSSNGGSGSQLVVRGLTTGSNPISPLTATYIDETPYTVVSNFAGAFASAPNLDTYDMQRIEVLRGPQGTLYGASALAGLLKFVTNAPDPSGFAASAEAGVSTVDGGGNGFEIHGMVNIPLSSDTALRLVAYDNYNPGFIDDPSRGLKNINGSHYIGGRASLLYQPTENFSVRLNALYQDRSWNDWGNEDVDPGTLKPTYCKLCQENDIGQPGHVENALLNATVNWDLGFVQLVSATSYSEFRPHWIWDEKNLDPVVSGALGSPFGTAVVQSRPMNSVTQEVRLSSPADQSLEWQVGGFFNDQDSYHFPDDFYPIDQSTHTILYSYPTTLLKADFPTTYREYAGFANLDYHITPTFDIAAGGRYSHNHQTFREVASGLFAGNVDFGNSSSENDFTYSADARWHVTPDAMIYARVATGYTPGGPNAVTLLATVPHTFSSSTSTNYEIGTKSKFLADTLSVEISIFNVDWQKIQLDTIDPSGAEYTSNGGRARSSGAEWTLEYAPPVDGLTLNFNGAYTDAHLTQPTPPSVGGSSGDSLPGVPLWQTSLGANYEHMLFADWAGFLGVDWRFTGSRFANFEAGSPRQHMPSFNIVDLRAGIENNSWSLTVYAKNVGNEVAINYLLDRSLSGGNGIQSASVYQPRTVGITLAAKF